DNDHAIIQIGGSVYNVNIKTGKRGKRLSGSNTGGNWYADYEGNVRLGFSGFGTAIKVMMRGKNGGGWKTIDRYDRVTGNARYDVIGFSPEENIIYAGSEVGGAPYAYYKYDLIKREFVEKLFGKDNIPTSGMLIDPYTGQIDGYLYTKHEEKAHYINKRLRSIQKFLDKQFPDTNNFITSYNRNKTRFIVFIGGPKYAGELMFFDIKTKKMMVISELYEGIDFNDLSDMVPVTYKARDGLEIPSYLSLPPDREAKNLPTVILPHGGPESRDERGFDQWVQFLTSRGYAVLQMNYRGSTGYGTKFHDMGIQQWGRAMQDDITDGTKWMIEQGYSNPDRICIMGASYGGYSALNGIAREPDLYKCAISFAGIGDMRLFQRDASRFTSETVTMKYIKNQNHSLDDISPASNIKKIKAPVLLMHGTLDSRVPYKQGPIFYKKMKSAGKDIKFVKLEDETHFLELEKNKLIFLKEVDKFLKKHLK
ncbi:prolyl oligopeptidase family protein, partial [hydrothermal vent metagenome]